MPFIDSLAQYAKPIDTSGVSQNINAGIQTGMNLAERQQQNEQMAAEIAFKKQQLESAKDEHMTGLVDKVVKTDDPTLRKQYAAYAATVGNKLGRPLSPEFTDAINKSDDLRQAWMQDASQRNMADPNQRYAMLANSAGIMMGGPEKIAKFMDDVGAQDAKLKEAQALAGAKTDLQNQKDSNATAAKRRTALDSPEWQRALRGDMGPEMQRRAEIRADSVLAARQRDTVGSKVGAQDATAAARTAGIGQKDRALDQKDVGLDQGQQKVDQGSVKLQQGDRGLDIRQQLADQAGVNIDSLVDYRKHQAKVADERVDLTKQALAQKGQTMNLGQQKLMLAQEGKIETMPAVKTAVQSVQLADLGMSRLKPGMKWIDMSDVAADYNRLITGSNRAAFQGEDRRTFDSYKATLDKFMGKVTNQEAGGPTDAEIGIWRDRFGAMRDLYAKQHDNLYQKFWQSRVQTGLVPQGIAQTHFELNKMTEGANWSAPRGQTAAPMGQQVQMRNGTAGPVGERPSAVMAAPPPAPGTAGTAAATQPAAQPQAAPQPQVNLQLEQQRATNAIRAVKQGILKGVDEATIRAKYRLKTGQDLPAVQ